MVNIATVAGEFSRITRGDIMKRRYSPAARRAHLRAMHHRPVVQEVEQTGPIQKLVESYQQGFITAVELADLILQALPKVDDDGLPLPTPEPAPNPYCSDYDLFAGVVFDAELIE